MCCCFCFSFFFFSSRRRHTRLVSDWSSDVCSSDLFTPDHASRAEGRLEERNFERTANLVGKSHTPESLRVAPRQTPSRSEERRVGKECRSRWSPDHEKKRNEEQRRRERRDSK